MREEPKEELLESRIITRDNSIFLSWNKAFTLSLGSSWTGDPLSKGGRPGEGLGTESRGQRTRNRNGYLIGARGLCLEPIINIQQLFYTMSRLGLQSVLVGRQIR